MTERAGAAAAVAVALALAAGAAGCASAPSPSVVRQESDLDRAYAALDLRPYEDDHAWRQRGNLVVGERTFDSSFGLGRADQAVVGVELIGAVPNTWLDVEVGLYGSGRGDNPGQWLDRVFGEPSFEDLAEDGEGLGTSSVEFSLGVQKQLRLFGGGIRPFVGAGAAAIRRRSFRTAGGDVVDDSDADLGWYAHAGVHVYWGDGVSLGLDFRRLGGTDMVLDGLATSGDYESWALSFAFGI